MMSKTHSRRRLRLAALLLSGTALAGLPLGGAWGQTVWTGTTSTDWNTAGNWSTNAVPTSADDTVIDTQTPDQTILNGGTGAANTLTVGQAGSSALTVTNHAALTASGVNIALDGGVGSLIVENSSTLNVTTGGQFIQVGGAGAGSMSILSNAVVTDSITSVDGGATVTIDGAVLNSPTLNIGTEATQGFVVVQNGGTLNSNTSTLGGLTQGGQGTVTVTGSGSHWGAGSLSVGSNGTGTVTLQNDGTLASGNTTIGGAPGGSNGPDSGTLAISSGGVATTNGAATVGQNVGNTGAVTVDGATSAWTVHANPLLVGDLGGTGSISLTAGGTVTSDTSTTLGTTSGSSGTITVDGTGSLFNGFGVTTIGSSGTGVLTVQNHGQFTGASISLADQTGSTGTMTVTGAGSSATLSSALSVGSSGTGNLSVLAGGVVHSATGIVGFASGSNGTALVDGTNSLWGISSVLSVGDLTGSTGSLTVSGGGSVTDHQVSIGNAGGAGTVAVNGAGSTWTTAADASVGVNSSGTLLVQAGGVATIDGDTYIGRNTGAVGTATVSGTGSDLVAVGTLHVGGDGVSATGGVGTLNVTAGGEVDTSVMHVGDAPTGAGTILVDGTGSLLNVTSNINVGAFGTGDMTVRNGGALTADSLGLGDQAGSNGALTLTGAGTTATMISGVLVGNGGTGTLSVLNGATLTNGDGGISFASGTSTATVDGVGSSWTSNGNLIVGSIGTGVLTVSGGGAVSGTNVFIGGGGAAIGEVLVTDAGSSLTSTGSVLNVGYQGTGDLTVQNGGLVSAPGGINIATFGGVASTLTIGGDNLPMAPGTVDTPTVGFPMGVGTIAFNHTSSNYVFAPVISGAGHVNSSAGVTHLTGVSPNFTGALNVFGGTVFVDGQVAALTAVANGAALGGSGGISNAVSVAGSLIGVQGQTLSMTSLSMTNTASINASLSSPGGPALFAVTNDVQLNGTLNVISAGGAGVYRLIAYGTTETGSLTIGTTPFGTTASDFSVQTSVAGQVNLLAQVNTPTAPTMVFWDGDAPGSANNNAIDGGSGVWSVTSNNWADSTGATNGAFPAGALAVFEGHPGTVTVDDSGGAVTVTGMQFANDGFVIAGDPLTLNGQATIRVGDGTPAGAAYTATISAPLTGTGGLTKTDLGTLNLTGVNDYTGATTVAAGRLAVNGSAANSVVTVQSGGILGGNGTVGGVVAQAGGTVAPGNSIGKLTVAGNYAQASGSIFEVQLTSTDQADRIDVSGTATLSNGAVLKVIKTDAAPYVLGTRYTVLTAGGGLTGTYNLTGDVTAFYGLTADYDAHDVYLDVIKVANFSSVAATHNQKAAAGALDGLGSSNPLSAAVGNEPDDVSARKAFDQLSGEVHASVKSAMVEDGRFVRDAALGRMRSAFGAAGAPTTPGASYDDNGNPVAVAADALQPVFWGQGFGSWGAFGGDGNAGAASTSDSGLFLGGDAPIGPTGNWRLGVLGGYSRTVVDVNSRASSASSDNYHLGAYGGGEVGAIGLRFGAAYAWRDVRANRSVSLPGVTNQLASSYGSNGAQVFGEAGYRIDLKRVSLEPYAAAAFTDLRTDGFTEKGGIAALTGKADTTDVTFTTLGMRGSSVIKVSGAAVTLRGGLGWRHAFGDVTPTSTTGFAGSSLFSTEGVAIGRDAVVVDAGFDVSVARDVNAGLSYTGQGATRAQDSGVKVNINWRF